MMRLRDGKYCGRAPVSGGCSERSVPPLLRICCAMQKLVRGAIYVSASPEPGTAIVWSPFASAASCAQASAPSASPETIDKGWPRSPSIRYLHASRPYGVSARDPTTASFLWDFGGSVPRTQRRGGGCGISRREPIPSFSYALRGSSRQSISTKYTGRSCFSGGRTCRIVRKSCSTSTSSGRTRI